MRPVYVPGAIRCRSGSPLLVGPPLQISAARDELAEGFGVVQQNAVIGHLLVIHFEDFQSVGIWYQLQFPGHDRRVINGIARPITRAEEARLEFRDFFRERFVIKAMAAACPASSNRTRSCQ